MGKFQPPRLPLARTLVFAALLGLAQFYGPTSFAKTNAWISNTKNLADDKKTEVNNLELQTDPAPNAADQQLLDSIKTWSLEDRAGQLLMVGFRSFAQIKQARPGGVVLFSWSLDNVVQSHDLIASLKKYAKHTLKSPVFVAIDHEGGKVLRLKKGMTPFPDAAAVGALKDPEMAFRFGQAMGLELSSLGIHMNFAPVLDLGNARSFLENRVWGNDPQIVAELTRSYIEGLQSSKVLAIPKHFPGHGGTGKDSHFYLPVIAKSFERIWNEDLVPFRSAVDAGIKGLMTAHVQIPSVDRLPASLSPNFLQDLLRNRLGYKGLIITDDIEMAGMSKVFPEPPENLAFRSLQAGTDMILVVWSEATQYRIVQRVVSAVKTGEVSEDWLNQKVLKIQKLKSEIPSPEPSSSPQWAENLRRPETLALVKEIYRRAPLWNTGHELEIVQSLRERWKENWSVVLPQSKLTEYWKRQRPNDTVFVVPRRADGQDIKNLDAWLREQVAASHPLWVVTAPRASASEDAFQVIRSRLGQLSHTEGNAHAPVVWVHQGANPVALLRDPKTIPVGIVSLFSGSLSGFESFFNSVRQPPPESRVSTLDSQRQLKSFMPE